jgi:adenine-specific DNA-methyltransferase
VSPFKKYNLELSLKQMVLNYIGSKRSLAQRLVDEFKKEWTDLSGYAFCDAFAGTGALAVAIAPHVKTLIVNDWEDFSVAVLHAQFNPPPVSTAQLVATLNATNPTTGAITSTYSELGNRRYFTTLNAQKIDGIRAALRSPTYTNKERNFLKGALVAAADSVANVASIYGAYLKDFKNSSTNPITVRAIPSAAKPAQVLQRDAQELCLDGHTIEPDTLLYLDPPYNQRQYGANYFPLNAIVDISANTFEVAGVTGIPTSGYKKSAWCSTKTATNALKTILEGTPARRLALSYNQEGILSHAEITSLFTATGWRVRRVEIPYKRFASQKDLEPNTIEYLFVASRI